MTTSTHHDTHTSAAEAPVAPMSQQYSGQAIASLVLGVLSVTGAGLFTGIPALILGIIDVRKHPHSKGMALAGLITGGIGTLLSLVAIIFFVALVIFGLAVSDTPSYQQPPTYTTPNIRT